MKYFFTIGFLFSALFSFSQVLDSRSIEKLNVKPAPIIYISSFPFDSNQNRKITYTINSSVYGKAKKLPKALKKLTKNYSFIAGGKLIKGDYYKGVRLLHDKDSNLIICSKPTKQPIESFLIGTSEITNKEYREFVSYVRDSIAHTLLALYGNPDEVGYHFIDPYPDLCIEPIQTVNIINWEQKIDWDNEDALLVLEDPNGGIFLEANKYYHNSYINLNPKRMVYRYYKAKDSIEFHIGIYPNIIESGHLWQIAEIKLENYFLNPTYDDYPVVGINYEQAIAFVHWKNSLLSKILVKGNYSEFEGISYSLPSLAQWQYVATTSYDKSWYFDNMEGYTANYGTIKDNNGLLIKSFFEDGYLFTAPNNAYSSLVHRYQLNNLYGNVWEWTSGNLDEIQFEQTVYLKRNDTILKWNYQIESTTLSDDLLKQFLNYCRTKYPSFLVDSLNTEQLQELENIFSTAIHNYHVKQNSQGYKIAMGGSWSDSPISLWTEVLGIFPHNYSQINMGLRLVIKVPKGKETYFINK